MSKVQNLSPAELSEFRRWFQGYDSALWDQEIERDALTGKLDRVRDEALWARSAEAYQWRSWQVYREVLLRRV
jgi:hypothetical protein